MDPSPLSKLEIIRRVKIALKFYRVNRLMAKRAPARPCDVSLESHQEYKDYFDRYQKNTNFLGNLSSASLRNRIL